MCLKLPNWVLTHTRPSVYDSESATAIEQTAKVYGAMQDLIEEYNTFAENFTKKIEKFEQDIQDSNCMFKKEIISTLENYIKSVDMRIDEAVNYLKTNLEDTVEKLISEGITDGTFGVSVVYDEATESMNIIASGGVVNG